MAVKGVLAYDNILVYTTEECTLTEFALKQRDLKFALDGNTFILSLWVFMFGQIAPVVSDSPEETNQNSDIEPVTKRRQH